MVLYKIAKKSGARPLSTHRSLATARKAYAKLGTKDHGYKLFKWFANTNQWEKTDPL